VTILLAGLTATVIAGAVVAVSAREARAALLGLLVVLLASPLIADPLPAPLPFSARIAAALLAARLIAIAIRDFDRPTAGSRLGWPVEALAAVAAAVVGRGAHGLGAAALGPVWASAAGFALGVLSAAPIVTSRDTFRLGVGAMLLLSGGLLVRTALGGTPSELEQLVTAGLVAGVGGAVAMIVRGAREATGDLVAIDAGSPPPAAPRHLGRSGPRPAPVEPAAHPAARPTGRPVARPAPPEPAPDASTGR
jgi:hypothetical protein